ncbi:MAG: hypothetical protein U9Q12_03560 [Patescibacteria group bacterium]|nr:hypothetical protein [Patescibacteria group bacterium]
MKNKKVIFMIIIAFFIFIRPTPAEAKANAVWGLLNVLGDTYKQLLEEIFLAIRDSAASAAKMAAINQTTSTINSLLYDGSSSPRNIGNYYDFIASAPEEKAVTYAETFLTDAMRGTASSDYTGGGGGALLGGSIETAGQQMLTQLQNTNTPTIDYEDECTGNDFFSEGNYKCFATVMDNSLNIPTGMAMEVDKAYDEKKETEQKIQEAKASFSGVLPDVDENGNIKLPSSVVEEIQLQQIKLPLQALAAGDTKVFSSVIKGVAASMMMEIVKNGFPEDNQSENSQSNSGGSTTWTNPDTGEAYR